MYPLIYSKLPSLCIMQLTTNLYVLAGAVVNAFDFSTVEAEVSESLRIKTILGLERWFWLGALLLLLEDPCSVFSTHVR